VILIRPFIEAILDFSAAAQDFPGDDGVATLFMVRIFLAKELDCRDSLWVAAAAVLIDLVPIGKRCFVAKDWARPYRRGVDDAMLVAPEH